MPVSKPPLKLGVIGVGLLGGGHARFAATNPDADLVAIADPRSSVGRKVANETKSTWYGDYREMLKKEDLDVAIVATPDPLHREPIVAAFRSGVRHVITEKPMATTRADAGRIRDAAEKAAADLYILFPNRFHPWTGASATSFRKACSALRATVMSGSTITSAFRLRCGASGARSGREDRLQRTFSSATSWICFDFTSGPQKLRKSTPDRRAGSGLHARSIRRAADLRQRAARADQGRMDSAHGRPGGIRDVILGRAWEHLLSEKSDVPRGPWSADRPGRSDGRASGKTPEGTRENRYSREDRFRSEGSDEARIRALSRGQRWRQTPRLGHLLRRDSESEEASRDSGIWSAARAGGRAASGGGRVCNR